jgi:lipoprotein-releasing system permease protein
VSLIAPETLLLPAGEGPPVLKVTVKGLVSLQNSEIDGNLLIYDFEKSFPERFRSASLWRGVEIFLKDPHHFEGDESLLKSLFPSYKVQSWRDLNGALFFALKLERTVMTSFLALAVLIVSFTLVTVLALLVAQKRKDIGMMMVMGLSRRKTHWVFCAIGMWLAFAGTVIGLLVGSVAAVLMEIYPVNILPDIYYDSRIPAVWSFHQTLLIFFFSLVLAFVGSYFPLKMWLKMTPTQALRKD